MYRRGAKGRGISLFRQQRFLPLPKLNLNGVFLPLGYIENFFPSHICLLTPPVWFVYVLLIVCGLSYWLIIQVQTNDLFISWIPGS